MSDSPDQSETILSVEPGERPLVGERPDDGITDGANSVGEELSAEAPMDESPEEEKLESDDEDEIPRALVQGRGIRDVRRESLAGGERIRDLINVALEQTVGLADKPQFDEISWDVLRQLRSVFVGTPSYPRVSLSARTVVVTGAEHSGKFCCSVNFALDIQDKLGQKMSIVTYARLRRESMSLIQCLESLEENSIVILEDAFEKKCQSRRGGIE